LKGSRFAYLLLVLANLFWAGNWVMGRAVRGDVPPLALSFWRWVIATLLFLPLAWPHLRHQLPALRRHWRWVTVFGVLGTAFYNALAYIGMSMTTATNGVLLNSLIPIVIVAGNRIFFGHRLQTRESLGIAVSLAGMAVIVGRGDFAALARLELNRGDLWVIASVVAWAMYTLLLPKRPADLHPQTFLVAISAVGLLAVGPFYAWEIGAGRHINATPGALAGIAYAGVVAAFLGFICWNRGVAEVGPARAGLFMHLVPVFGILLSLALLGERLEIYHGIGMLMIFAGIALTTMARPALASR
jgi:drug/metabolite transporter (DMT)-like permease